VRAVTLELKPPGSWYAVVLRRDWSGAKVAAMGAFGGKATFPAPDLGRQCVCCDAADVEIIHFDASTDRFQCDPIAIPVCRPCRDHVKTSTTAAQLLGASICVGGGLALWGAMQALWPVAGVGAAITGGCVWLIVSGRAKLRELAGSGHHAGLEIMAHPGQCAVRTTNRRVAQELVQRHAEWLHRVR
jgi:hypothetical protein